MQDLDDAIALVREALHLSRKGTPFDPPLCTTLFFISPLGMSSSARRGISIRLLSSPKKNSTFTRKDTLIEQCL